MIIVVNCAIRSCPKTVKIESAEYRPSTDFALCNDCETSVVLDTHLRMNESGDFSLPKNWTFNFAVAFNGWRRRRKGVTIGHRSGVARAQLVMKREDVAAIDHRDIVKVMES
ncbi:MAG: hypothetical protein WAU89_23425 [Candidatus Acidiferrales bacterium]